jgi:hypothetical protein
MAQNPARRLTCVFAVALLFVAPLIAYPVTIAKTQTPAANPVPASDATGVPIRGEQHHHLVLENSYVHVYFVEIPGHDSVPLHRHDLPYVSVPPPGEADALGGVSSGPEARPAVDESRVRYTFGGFSHAVTNPSDLPLRNIAIELVRPQGTIRNRCREVLKDQPKENCDMSPSGDSALPRHYALFETDEIVVEHWEVGPNSTSAPWDNHLDILVAALTGASISAAGVDSAKLPHGIVWLPGGSHPVFKTASSAGHFVAITFKDSGSASASNNR